MNLKQPMLSGGEELIISTPGYYSQLDQRRHRYCRRGILHQSLRQHFLSGL